jgi:hypothetical protein
MANLSVDMEMSFYYYDSHIHKEEDCQLFWQLFCLNHPKTL